MRAGLTHRRAIIVGAGQSGLAVAAALAAVLIAVAAREKHHLGTGFRQALYFTPLKLIYRIDTRGARKLNDSRRPVIYVICEQSKLDPVIAQALLPMARACGYDPLLVDPREAFGSAARFPGERISNDWPDAALAEVGLDARTAVVTLTHDPKLDDPAIRAALGSEVFYLGCLGSTRTHAKRVERLREAGFDAAALARIHAPVGLDIGARSPAEIAVSIMAEITEALRRNPAGAPA